MGRACASWVSVASTVRNVLVGIVCLHVGAALLTPVAEAKGVSGFGAPVSLTAGASGQVHRSSDG